MASSSPPHALPNINNEIDWEKDSPFSLNTPYMSSGNFDPLFNPPHAPPPPHIPTWAEYYYNKLGEHHVPTRLPDSSLGDYDLKYKKFYDERMYAILNQRNPLNFSSPASKSIAEIITGLAACYVVPKLYKTVWRVANPNAPLPRTPVKFFFGLAKYGGFLSLYSCYCMLYRTEWRFFPAPFGHDPELPATVDEKIGVEKKNWPLFIHPGNLLYNIVYYKKLKAEIDESHKRVEEKRKMRALEFLYGTPEQKESAAKPRPTYPPLY